MIEYYDLSNDFDDFTTIRSQKLALQVSIMQQGRKSLSRRRKTFISTTDYDLIIAVLHEPNTGNVNLETPKDRHWIKNTFQLRELGTVNNPNTQIITVAKNEMVQN
ncbi:hypothetical protein C2G38_2163949 [Gigaspora rosea]|uniref:Uncharacterized protein n=1 Tax=Gigaspora rosea TaxID=44941 RepID=A0A397VWN9_9GLOM|nr:hypothetical protein C2G38_2163949 [Gigaspora rosea]